jgi:exosortase H (IPTLxxWG-CTERM-specific)
MSTNRPILQGPPPRRPLFFGTIDPSLEEPPLSQPDPRRAQIAFLGKFFLLLLVFFGLTAPRAVNDAVVEPFTAGVAKASGAVCGLVSREVSVTGTVISSPAFAVNVRQGCNGLEAVFLFLAAVLAFPVAVSQRLLGALLGTVAIQLVNLVRVVALFFTGVLWPDVFEESHTVVWQGVVILAAVALFVAWASWVARKRPRA